MIKDLKQLQAFLKLCRKQGVTEISFGDCNVKFGDLPLRGSLQDAQLSDESPASFDDLTPEQQMFMSAGGADE